MAEQAPSPRPNFRSNVPLPPKLDLTANITHNWKKWRQVWDSFEIATNLKDQDHKYRVATFITAIGSDALEVYNGLPFEDENARQNMDSILTLMERHCLGETNVIYERYIFNNRNQKDGESIDTYATQLRALAQTCDFQVLQDELIRDRIFCGIQNDSTRKELLQEPGLTLKKCIDMCRASDSTTAQVKAMSSKDTEVHYMSGDTQNKKSKPKYKGKQYSKGPGRQKSTQSLKYNCKYCGRKHQSDREKCPAYGKTCNLCGGLSHFAAQCFNKKKEHGKHSKVHAVFDETDSSSEEDLMTVETVEETINSVDRPTKFQVDSGATCNVISSIDLPAGTQINKANVKLKMYNNSNINALGKATIRLVNPKNSKKYRGEFVVVPEKRVPLLGSRSAQQLKFLKVLHENILTVNTETETDAVTAVLQAEQRTTGLSSKDVLTQFKDVFEGEMGCLEGKQKLEIDPSIPPVKQAVRRIPHAFKDKLKTELDRLEKNGVIARVDTPTDWVSSLVIVKKPSGKPRICIDPKPLNKALRRSHYPLPVMEDLLPDLAQAKVFSKCDLKNGFWHIELEEESSFLTTFGTSYGRFRWVRLPFGISPAPEIFQYRIDQALQDLPGTFRMTDDILIIGEGATMEQAMANHDERLLRFMTRCREKNIRLNASKFELKRQELPFIGHQLTSSGLKPDPKKVEAMLRMPKPTDVQGVQRFIGVANYLSKFLEKLSDMCEPLRQLTKKDVEWKWMHEHDEAFNAVQRAITEAPVLKYFNSQQDISLQCDASETGLGATLLEGGQPVAYGSRALTSTERNYAQIEKELLSILFGFTKFHQYVYGHKVSVESDHQPLETIHKKPLLTAPKRLQRMLLALQKYDYQITYKRGKEMHLADTLSRAYLNKPEQQETGKDEVLSLDDLSATEVELQQINMADYLPITDTKLTEIQKETQLDESLQAVIAVIQTGWPNNKSEVPTLASPYFYVCDELSVQDGILFRGSRCVIPKSLRPDMLKIIHSSHSGIESCRRRARDTLYWPNMNTEISDVVSKCDICKTFERKQPNQPLVSHDILDRPWSKLGTDLFSYHEKDYLVTVDYFSDFFELDRITDKTGKEVIPKLKAHLARHGIPDVVVSDNGPPFNSEDFADFAAKYEFQHVTSSPGYPKSNGKVESAVKVAKSIIRKATKANTDPYLALLDYRNTPTEGTDSSPSQRLFNRRTKTRLPTCKSLLLPTVPANIMVNKRKKLLRQAKYYNRSARKLRPLEEGEQIRVQPIRPHVKEWSKATVNKQVNIRSYELEMDGKTLRRNRSQLRPTAEPPTITNNNTRTTVNKSPLRATSAQKSVYTSRGNHGNVKSSIPCESTSIPTITPTHKVTKSGRVLKTPSYLKDFTV